ncbi:MAG: hypothetical protein ACK4OM_05650 [Alphaproteobacteria bacterium]
MIKFLKYLKKASWESNNNIPKSTYIGFGLTFILGMAVTSITTHMYIGLDVITTIVAEIFLAVPVLIASGGIALCCMGLPNAVKKSFKDYREAKFEQKQYEIRKEQSIKFAEAASNYLSNLKTSNNKENIVDENTPLLASVNQDIEKKEVVIEYEKDNYLSEILKSGKLQKESPDKGKMILEKISAKNTNPDLISLV